MFALKLLISLAIFFWTIAYLSKPFIPPRYTNPIFNETNWATYVCGLSVIGFIFSAIAAALLFIWHYL